LGRFLQANLEFGGSVVDVCSLFATFVHPRGLLYICFYEYRALAYEAAGLNILLCDGVVFCKLSGSMFYGCPN
jgi:hypothetical protein